MVAPERARAKLDSCIAVLQVLNMKGQLSATKIAFHTKIDRSFLGECIAFLAKQSALIEIENNNLVVYDITQIGKKALRFFKLDNSPVTNKIIKAKSPKRSSTIRPKKNTIVD